MTIEAMKQALENELSASDFIDKAPKSWDKTERTEWARLQAMLHNIRVFKKAMRQAIAEAEKQDGWVLREVLFSNGEPIAHREAEKQEQGEPLRDHSCKVCGNKPDAEGLLEHGSGCYTQSAEGGGVEFISDAVEQEQSEPVAWRYGALLYHDKLDALEFMRTSNDGYMLEPLYTHPQPKREPLTDDEIWKNDDIMAANSRYGANFETLREVVRAVEVSHGIKENT